MDLTFESFPLVLAQILRGLCIVVGPFCIILCTKLAGFVDFNKHRRRVYAGLAFLTTTGVYTQVERWEEPATLRLFIVTPGMFLVCWGLLGIRKYKTQDV